MTKPRKTADVMFPLVETYLNGQQTQKDFCCDHGISLAKLNYWLAKYRRQHADKPSAFVEITPAGAVEESALMEIVYLRGVRLRLFAPVGPAQLARLLTLEQGGSAHGR